MGGASKDEQYQDLMFRKLVDALTNQAKDLVREINKTMRELDGQTPDPAVDSMQVQNFYSEMEAKISAHPHFAHCSKEDIDEYVEGIERYLTHKMYKRFFVLSQEDIERDVELSKRFRALEFVKLEHLEVSPGLVSDASLVHAINSLKPMDDCRSPRQKLVCILKCCHYINNILMSNAGGDFGADDFTPILIYVVIRAQPERLVSNLAFIERFRNQSRLTGEAQYYFTQLYGAATFIETMDASSLKVNPDEFIAHMLNHGIVSEEQLQSGSPMRRMSRNHPGSPFARTASSLAKETGQAPPAEAANPADASEPPAASPHVPSAPGDAPPARPPPPKSTAELQADGLPLIIQADAAGQLRARHRYLYTSAEDLTVRDVHQLLTDYKELVLQYEALSLAINKQRELHRAGHASAKAKQAQPPPTSTTSPVTPQPRAPIAQSTPSSSGNLISLDDTPTQHATPSQLPPPSTSAATQPPAATGQTETSSISTPSSSATVTTGDLISLTPTAERPSTPARMPVPSSIEVPSDMDPVSDTLALLTPTPPPKEQKALSSELVADSNAPAEQPAVAVSGHSTAEAASLAPLPSLDHLLQPDGTSSSSVPASETSLI